MGFDMNQCFARRHNNKTTPQTLKKHPFTSVNNTRVQSDLNSIRFNMEMLMNTNASGSGVRRG
tara:strand:+ start:11848 stop:12036 length:189 start_codon:yes stop_codon:yes gene_type:complete